MLRDRHFLDRATPALRRACDRADWPRRRRSAAPPSRQRRRADRPRRRRRARRGRSRRRCAAPARPAAAAARPASPSPPRRATRGRARRRRSRRRSRRRARTAAARSRRAAADRARSGSRRAAATSESRPRRIGSRVSSSSCQTSSDGTIGLITRPGGELGIEEGRLLRHDLAGVGDRLDVRHRRRVHEEHRLHRRILRQRQRRARVLDVAQVGLLLLRRAIDAEDLLDHERVQAASRRACAAPRGPCSDGTSSRLTSRSSVR